MGLIRYRLDRSYRRIAGGVAILGGSPLRVFRLTTGGQRVADALERGEPIAAAQRRLTDRLAACGAIHPRPTGSSFSVGDVTVVRPVFAAVPRPVDVAGVAEVVVVDDASTPPVVAPLGTRLLRLAVNAGPAGARNAGLAEVRTALVAFVDADVSAGPGWLAPLIAHFDDPRVALVAPRVTSAAGPGVVARYETARSPLDLGPDPGRVAPGTRVSYVPAATIVCRVEALAAIGGFVAAMRAGEDVDLVWRLLEAGWTARYEPAAVVVHQPRANLTAMLRQRFTYGSAATELEQRHPGTLPLRLNPWTAASVTAVAARLPIVAAAAAGWSAVSLRRRLADLPWTVGTSLAGRGHLGACRAVAAELTRSWWPAAAIGLSVRRTRPAVLAAILLPALFRRGPGSRRDSGLDPLRYLALSVADDVAYGVGVWRGALARRSGAAIRPRLGGYRSTPT